MIRKYTIYGERCSGTNYLEELMTLNFDIPLTWEYGHKHFFGFQDLNNSDDTLFIGIVREPYDWINSLYREQHHLPKNFKNMDDFLNCEFYSLDDDTGIELIKDRNMCKPDKRYENIFEMRNTKLSFLLDYMPSHVENYILIRYEDLINDFQNTMYKIFQKGLKVKHNIEFPINTSNYKKSNYLIFVPNCKPNHIAKEKIFPRLNTTYENRVCYSLI